METIPKTKPRSATTRQAKRWKSSSRRVRFINLTMSLPGLTISSWLHQPSKGQFLNVYIRNSYPYSRVG
jgi:hypothetical protein